MSTQMSPVMRSALEDARRELAGRFRGVFSEETISRVLEDSYEQIGERPTVGPNFMPIFVKRFARERLEAVAQAEGLVAKALPEVLFICVRNAGRSQMAAALAHELSNGQVAVRSAGLRPDREDRSGRGRGDGRARDRCPDGVPQAADRRGRPRRRRRGHARLRRRVSRSSRASATRIGTIADPAGQPLEVVRRIRYDIHHHVTDLLDSLSITVTAPDRPGARP